MSAVASLIAFVARMSAGRLAGAVLAGTLACVLFEGGAAFAAGPPEAPVTEAAGAVTSSSATLNGELNPGASVERLAYQFFYSPGAECTGYVALPEPPLPEVEGNHQKVSLPVTGLEGNTTYRVCLLAINPINQAESTFGSTMQFTTLASKPVVVSQTSAGVTPFAATLQAEVNPENQSTSCLFEYGETLGEHKVPCEQGELSGGSPLTATLALSGLSPNTKYHFRAVVTNVTGTAEGLDTEFTTLAAEKPIVDGEGASGVTPTTVTLEAQVNPNYQETTCGFQYGTDKTLASSTTIGCEQSSLGSGFGDQAAGAHLENLIAGETYYYRMLAENATGTSDGTIQSFTTVGHPLVSAGAAQSPTRNTVVLSGTVDPVGAPTTYHFVYIDQAGYEAAIAGRATNPYAAGASTAIVSVGEGYEAHPVIVVAGELLPSTTYHYALVASNAQGKVTSPDRTFATLAPTPPIPTTGQASNVSQTTATLSATINTQGLQSVYGFEVGSAAGAYGQPTGLGAVGAGANEASVTLNLTALQPGTTYHYRISATNADGTTYGADQSFTTGTFANVFVTPPAPLSFLAVPSIQFPAEPAGVKHKAVAKTALTKALEACKHKPKGKRASCQRKARKRYGAKPA